MRSIVIALALTFLPFVVGAAVAQQPSAAPQQVDQLLQDINADWGVVQVSQTHLLKSLQALVSDRDKVKAELKAALEENAALKKAAAPAAPPPK